MIFSTFEKKFSALSPIEQELLKILSIAYEEVNQTKMLSLLSKFNILSENGKRIDATEFKKIRKTLEEKAWISIASKGQVRNLPDSREFIMRIAAKEVSFSSYFQELEKLFPYKEYGFYPRSFGACIRDLRKAMYDKDEERVNQVLNDIEYSYIKEWRNFNFYYVFFHPFDGAYLDQFDNTTKHLALRYLIPPSINELEPIKTFIDYLEKNITKSAPKEAYPLLLHLNAGYLLQGDIDKANVLLSKETDKTKLAYRKGWIQFLEGDPSSALKNFDLALRLNRKESGNKKFHFTSIAGLFHVLAILQNKGKNYLKKTLTYCDYATRTPLHSPFQYLAATALFQGNRTEEMKEKMAIKPTTSIAWLFWGLTAYWNKVTPEKDDLKMLSNCYKKSAKNNYLWIHMEFTGILSKLEPDEKKRTAYEKEFKQLQKKLSTKSLLNLVPVLEDWERSLEALLRLNQGKKGNPSTGATASPRLIYLVDFKDFKIQPKEQSINKSGKWGAGRNVALKRLKEGAVSCMIPQDAKVGQSIESYSGGWNYYNKEFFEFNRDKAFKALVGHPNLFLYNSPTVPVELVEQQAELLVEEKDGFFEIKFSNKITEAGVSIVKETPTRYKLIEFTKEHLEINRLLKNGDLKIPKKAKDQIVELVGNLSSFVTVQSSIKQKNKNIKSTKADPTIYVHLLPVGEGFKIEFFVKPFKSEPPYFKPGAGRENVLATIKGVSKQSKRDLTLEKKNANIVKTACPSLQKVPVYNGEWSFDEVEDCLNVLLELQPLIKEKQIILEHPKGEKLRIVGEADFGNLSLNIKKERDWFGISGDLKIDKKKVMDFQELLAKVEDNTMPFVEVSDGKFIAITNQLRRKLQEVNSLFNKSKKNLQFHPLAIPTLEEFTEVIDNIKVDLAWKTQVKRLQEARKINPKVPSTFKAELRDYQKTGFQWLSQLAHWGVGACLADDMGLGKTVQGLALILDRAKGGAALVVAPASVARNWLREAQKFTPTLNPMLFGQGDRKEMIKNLKPFDLLISSYGLMQTEEALLAKHPFTTIILDEAQAIKNRQTKRSKSAMKLQGDFKVLTTGTPIENHLGEIWNLFNFLNPGLLGSLEKFNNNFAIPIEKDQDSEKRQQLRRLIQPFILRRRKNDVLQELPEKTEITLTVELSVEERAFYEALRQNALASLAGLEEDGKQKRFQILAELMRLRQAACHPKLVAPESNIQSSKLQLLGEVIGELVQNGHKALVFSQFVKHLRLVEEWVQSQNISYQYLDGQTSLPKREKSINAFQAGEGDLFLISLKAGGTGLNLTAADYVIHLDPWWNPAVEDQASDRAHRIGQQRPVTIYRLVTEQTIEEKIVQLHAEKRNLADSLLEGTEASGKLSAKDLLNLIRGEE